MEADESCGVEVATGTRDVTMTLVILHVRNAVALAIGRIETWRRPCARMGRAKPERAVIVIKGEYLLVIGEVVQQGIEAQGALMQDR